MKKYFFLMLFFASCMAGHKVMTEQDFEMVDIGISKKELVQKAGKPYQIYKLGKNIYEYEYIERIHIEERTIEQVHYFFLIKNDRVVSKRVKYDKRPPLEFRNSLEMQTSYDDSKML